MTNRASILQLHRVRVLPVHCGGDLIDVSSAAQRIGSIEDCERPVLAVTSTGQRNRIIDRWQLVLVRSIPNDGLPQSQHWDAMGSWSVT